ncbi:MAG: hypothetical protein WD490_04835 [Opitutales bacterium]
MEAARPRGDPGVVKRVEELISSGLAAMTEPVWVELYQGIRGKREEARLEMTRSLCEWLEFDAGGGAVRATLPAIWSQRAIRGCPGAGLRPPLRNQTPGAGSAFRDDCQGSGAVNAYTEDHLVEQRSRFSRSGGFPRIWS